MQIKNLVVTNINQYHPWWLSEHAIPLTEFIGWSAHTTFDGSGGIMSTVGASVSMDTFLVNP